jgi:rhamnan synthesis protein F
MRLPRFLRNLKPLSQSAYRRCLYWRDLSLGRYGMKHVHIDGNLKVLGQNICILALFNPNNTILKSVLGLIRAIRKEGYDLILIVNGVYVDRDWFQGEVGARDTLITRPNLGRDFAAYQLATILLLDSGIPITRLLYCNDSVFFLDRNDSTAIFRRLITSDEDWIGMTENYHMYHISSWCVQFGPTVLKSPAFIRFWKNYLPINHHRHAIRHGEIRLSRILLEAGFVPHVMFNTQNLLKAVLGKYSLENEMHCLHELCSLPLATSFALGAKSLLASLFIGEQHNQTNNLTLLLISELGFPFIKKNMVSQGNIPLSLMLMLLQQLMTCFSDETAAEIRRRGMRGKLDAIKAAWN